MELVLRNARAFTSNPQEPWADTIVLHDGRFVFVGKESDWQTTRSATTIDLENRLVLPGLIDSHTHPAAVSRSRWHVALPRTHDVTEVLNFIRAYGEAHPPSEHPYLYFEYYPSTLFGDQRPTKELLDTAIADRPVLCQDASEHAAWVNSRMLELMGITKDTPDPVPGLEMFVRNADGEPTGHLLEGVHAHFVEQMYDKLGWRPPEEVTAATLRPVFRFLTEHGVTALFDALLDDEDTLRSLSEMDAAGELNLLYEGAPRFRTVNDLPEVISEALRYDATYGSSRIRIRTVKLFLDGTNETGNSAVLAPMVGTTYGHADGEIQMDTDELIECLLLCNAAGIDMHIHMVGDRAFRTGCDAVERAKAAAENTEAGWRTQVTFAHCELVDPADMKRPSQLGIIINWTPHWSAGYFGEGARKHLGDERWNRMYAFNEIAASGAVLAFSSDVVTNYELHRANPFFGMQVASTRVDPEYPLDSARYPESIRPAASSALPLEVLLKGYTADGAKQLRMDDRAGSIEVGKLANLVILGDDLFTTASEALGVVRPAAVIFEGRIVAGSL